MNDTNELNNDNTESKEAKSMNEFLVLAGIVAVWFALQLWILPRLGVST